MSLGDYTKCDLSAGIAKLDITALERQLRNHLILLATKIDAIVDNIRLSQDDKPAFSMCSTGNKRLNYLSKQLAEIVELLHTIQESKNREIQCVNLLEG